MGLFGSGIPDLKSLRAKAEEAYLKQKWKKALECYQELQSLSSFDPKIYQRIGEIHRKLGNSAAAIPFYKKTAQFYSKEGYWAKAVALGKILSELDPSDQTFQQYVAQQVSQETHPRLQVEDEIIDLKGSEIVEFETQASALGKPKGTLEHVPLFGELKQQEVSEILSKLQVKKFQAEEKICAEGERGESMYLISEGIVEVQSKDGQGQKVILAQLKGGDFFGEYSLVTGQPRHADVVSKTEVELMEITKKDFLIISNAYPRIWITLENYLLSRFVDTLCQKSEVFSGLTPQERKKLCEQVKIKKIESGQMVMEEKTEGFEMYFVKSGSFEVYSFQEGQKVHLGELGVGAHFGEMGMLTGNARLASVRCKSSGEILVLSRDQARDIFKNNTKVMEALTVNLRERQRDRRATLEAFKEAKISLALV